ncbi:MAG: hypothetical protein K2R98_33810, partial [Gemmataceae bacterium]|nr:hypothetical protein [Gemmataceae bacterium]
MKRLKAPVLAAALGFLLLGGTQARAAVSYGYDWSTTGASAVVSNNLNYVLVVNNEGFVPTGSNPNLTTGTDSVAATLSLRLADGYTSVNDRFGAAPPGDPGSFMLNLVITDKSAGSVS